VDVRESPEDGTTMGTSYAIDQITPEACEESHETKAMISIVVPSRDRPSSLRRALDSIIATTRDQEIEIIVVLEECDHESQEEICGLPFVKTVLVSDDYLGRPQDKYNVGYSQSKGEWIVAGADDITFDNEGWLSECVKIGTKGYVGLFDKVHPPDTYATLVMATRTYLETVMKGKLGLPWYHVWWADYEWAVRAKNAGAFVVCTKAAFTHHHWIFGTATKDKVYQLAESWYKDDQDTYTRREKLSFPDPE